MKKLCISKLTFCIIYSVFTTIFYNLYTWKKLIQYVNIEQYMDFVFICKIFISVNVLLILLLYIILQKKVTKFFAILFLICGAFTSYFILTYGVVIDRFAIGNMISTDINEIMGLLSIRMLMYMILLLILPIIFIIKIEIQNIKFFHQLRAISMLLIILTIIILPNYVQMASFFRKNHILGGYFVPANYISGSISYIKKKLRNNKKAIMIEDAKITKQDDVLVVLVIGETARRANFSIYGYSKNTNPELAKQDIIAINNATSCGTSTNVSVPCIFSPGGKDGLGGDVHENLISVLSRMNIKLSWFENNFGGCYDICDKIENKRFDGSPDGLMLQDFESKINNIKHNSSEMIVLHQNGSHGPLYYQRYEKEYEIFNPACKRPDVAKCGTQELINAYDNTIIYTDNFLSSIINHLQQLKKPSILIYASDHGESLGEYGLFLHGFPYILAPKEQKEIPFIIWTSKSFKKKYNFHKSCINMKEKHSHDNIFHTILGLFNIETKSYKKNLDILKDCG